MIIIECALFAINVKKRLDVHLEKVHLLKRGSKQYMIALKNSKLANIRETQFVQTLETESGSVEVSDEDSMKVFFLNTDSTS